MSTSPAVPTVTPWRRALAIGVLVAAVVSLVVIAFTWPARTSSAHDIPIAIAASAQQAQQAQQLGSSLTKGNDTFDVTRADDRAEAVRMLEERDVYGAVVLSAGAAPEVLTASAASPAVAQVMNGVATKLGAQAAAQTAQGAGGGAAAPTVSVTDVVPLSDDDPTGAGLVAAAFPLVMGGMLGGILLTFLVHGTGRRVMGLAVFVVVGGFAVAGILQGWLGILQGPYVQNVAAFVLALGSVAATILGASTLIGRLGVSVGPVLFLLFANPIASSATPSSFLPAPWGTIGQWFPPGAGSRLLRDISYFPDANAAPQWLILAGWTAFGLALMGVGALLHVRRRHAHHGEHVAVREHAPDPLTV
ncbi:hypothetical protein [Curtobacterium sp. VKM Ac-2887]|uniref:hypothetical protein n=1 Tax=Curtobacterium sp. VKM Ac-2887 TaxID=2783819 RepID=UPI00188CA4B9|nr:hypothetical protein [Curtobacterium sp. VKM Ac-2887]MBF4585657.1 hypothetical protein [Curtobacterium sp. VKM Ac-2887]